MQAEKEAHWEAAAQIQLKSGGFKHGTVGSHDVIGCVFLRRELCCHDVRDGGIVMLSEGR